MEVERERYEAPITGVDAKGHAIVGPEHKVGATEKFEFGVPGDAMSAVIGGSYTSNWNGDFLQRDLGKEGTCARLYLDKRVAVDIGDPESAVATKKRKLLFRHGFGYLCIPQGFSQDKEKLKSLYTAALQEYFDYEKRHPRPTVLQEATIIDEKGAVRRATVTAIDVRVGGGIIGSVEKQAAELKKASKLSEKELKHIKLQTKLHRKLRRSLQSGTPFRNPFIAPGKRLFPVEYK
jgi:hypothetical protein